MLMNAYFIYFIYQYRYHIAVGWDTIAVYLNGPNTAALIDELKRDAIGKKLIERGHLLLLPWYFNATKTVPFADQGSRHDVLFCFIIILTGFFTFLCNLLYIV